MPEQTLTYSDLGPRDQALIDEAGGGNQTVVSARMVKALNGNGNAAIMLSQLLFWSRTKADEDGWFYRTRQQMKTRCGLGKTAQKSAAKVLSDKNMVETDLRGMPARKHYRVRLGVVISALAGDEQDRGLVRDQDRTQGREQDRGLTRGSNYRQETKTSSNSAGVREDDAVQAYQDVFPRRPNHVQAEQIATKVDDLDLWRAVMRWWAANGHRAKSVGKMLNKYRQTDTPEGLYRDAPSGDGAPGTVETASKPDDPRTEIR